MLSWESSTFNVSSCRRRPLGNGSVRLEKGGDTWTSRVRSHWRSWRWWSGPHSPRRPGPIECGGHGGVNADAPRPRPGFIGSRQPTWTIRAPSVEAHGSTNPTGAGSLMFRRGGARKRRDLIEGAVIESLRKRGVQTWQISGRGLPDLLCWHQSRPYVLEVKSGARGRLSPVQARARAPWPVVRTVEEAVAVVCGTWPAPSASA